MLHVENLTASIGATPILEGLDLNVEADIDALQIIALAHHLEDHGYADFVNHDLDGSPERSLSASAS